MIQHKISYDIHNNMLRDFKNVPKTLIHVIVQIVLPFGLLFISNIFLS